MSIENVHTEILQSKKILQNRIHADQRIMDALEAAELLIKKLRSSELLFWQKRKIKQEEYILKLKSKELTEQVKIHLNSATDVLGYIELKIQNIQHGI